MSEQSRNRSSSAEDTKQKILIEAQKAFSEKGYAHTGVREIAARAGVAPSLVMKYFASKANLFEQAVIMALDAPITLNGPKKGFGKLVVDAIEDPDTNIVIPAMLMLSIGDEQAREIATQVASKHIITATAAWLGDEDAKARATAILMLSTGLTVFSRYLQVDNADGVLQQANDMVAQAIQQIVDEGAAEK